MITTSHTVVRRNRCLCALLAGFVAIFAAQPAVATPAEEGQEPSVQLTGAVYDNSGLPLIGALVAVSTPGSLRPVGLTVSDSRGRFTIGQLAPGVYSLMAQSFGFVSAVVPELAIPRPTPVRLQLRSARQVNSILSEGAVLDLGWAFRPGVRDVLRRAEPTFDGNNPVAAPTWLAGANERSMFANVGGEASLWTVAPVDGNSDDSRSSTEFAMGSIGGGPQNWTFRGQLAAGGVVRARSDVTRAFSDTHAGRLSVGFAGKDLAVSDGEHAARNMWVASITAEDYWRLSDSVQLGFGLSVDHYNYTKETGVISPRVQVAFVPIESVTVTTSVSYDAEAPGLAELRFQVDPLAVRYMDVLSVEAIDPERSLRYEVGIATATANTQWRARAYLAQITDELVGVYLANASGSSDYLVANLGDAVTQGFEVDVRRSFRGSVSGVISYGYGRREGGALPAGLAAERGLLADSQIDGSLTSVDVIHEVAAGIETVFGGYDTRLNAMYRWKTGVPVVRDGSLSDVYERLDVGIRQPLPFRALSSDWSALLQVQNVLGSTYDGVFNFRLGDAPVLSRLVSGGLAVRF